jgi:hypothetical protein
LSAVHRAQHPDDAPRLRPGPGAGVAVPGGGRRDTGGVWIANPATLRNVRSGTEPLLATYNQIQSIRAISTTSSTPTDRYIIDGEYRQVMIAGRGLAPEAGRRADVGQPPASVHPRLRRGRQSGERSHRLRACPRCLCRMCRPWQARRKPAGDLLRRITRDWVVVKTKVPEFDYPRAMIQRRSHLRRHVRRRHRVVAAAVLFAWQLNDFKSHDHAGVHQIATCCFTATSMSACGKWRHSSPTTAIPTW